MNFIVGGSRLGAGGDRSVAAALRGARPDYASAEVSLLANALDVVRRNGEVKFTRGDNARDIYNEIDGKSGESLAERYLKLILKHEPHLVEKHEDAFGYLFEEEYGDEAKAPAGTASVSLVDGPNPT